MPEKYVPPKPHSAGSARLWLVFLLGVVTTALGATYAAAMRFAADQDPPLIHTAIGGVLASLGGGILGAAIGLLVARTSSQESADDIRGLLRDTLTSNFTSEDDALDSLRRKWFHYHVTDFNEGSVWRHRNYHFDHSTSIGSIVSSITVEDDLGLSHDYRIEAAVRGSRLIIVQTRLHGDEPPVIQIYPNMMLAFQNVHCGVSFMQNWTGRHIVTRSILSRVPLIAGLSEGTVPDVHRKTLDTAWAKHFATSSTLFPGFSVASQQGSTP